MLFWHIAATTAIARYTFRDERMDLRFLALGAIIPDLIDTPIGLIWFESVGTVRLAAHSLVFAGATMTAIVLATRRGRPRKQWMPIAIGVLIHLFLDAMWASPETLWWPTLGLDFTAGGAAGVSGYLSDLFGDLRVWMGEVLGIGYLAVLAKRANLAAPAARHTLYTTGRVDVPIGLSDR
jgi:hypothetical protein